MARNKLHHFVPQFYLRQFRIDETDAICLATLDPFRIIDHPSSIKCQCRREYFYGKDLVLERIFTKTESELSPLIRRLNEGAQCGQPEIGALMVLAADLHHRTSKASEIAKIPQREIVAHVLRTAIANGELPAPDDPEDVERFDFPTMPQFLAQFAAQMIFELMTLEWKLLRPANGLHFITSDNPCVALNQFAFAEDRNRPCIGFAQVGFQLILPIGPSLCVCFFDPQVYKVGARRDRIVTLSALDTDLINGLQVQAGEKCLYFHSLEMRGIISGLASRYGHLRTRISKTIKKYQGQREGDSLLFVQPTHPSVPGGWSFMKPIRHVGVRPGQRRNELWSQGVEIAIDSTRSDPTGPDVFARLGAYFEKGGGLPNPGRRLVEHFPIG